MNACVVDVLWPSLMWICNVPGCIVDRRVSNTDQGCEDHWQYLKITTWTPNTRVLLLETSMSSEVHNSPMTSAVGYVL